MAFEAPFLALRSPVVVYTSPALIWPPRHFPTNDDRLIFTAKVISAALKFKSVIENGKVPIEYAGKSPLEMSFYEKLFSTCRIPKAKCDILETHADSKHFILVIDNQFFTITAYDGAKVLSESQILQQLYACFKLKRNEAPVGLFTSENRDTWAKIHEELCQDETNKKSLAEVQSSLFIVALDKAQKQVSDGATTAAHQILHGSGSKNNSGNRWFDKMIQFIISEDGINGLNYEHAPSEAVVVAKLSDFILSYLDTADDAAGNAKNIQELKHLRFNLTPSIENALAVAASNIDKLAENTEIFALHYNKFGKSFCKSQKLSPDSFIQMAILLTFYKIHQTPVSHYEATSLRMFKNGRTSATRSCSSESMAFVKAMCGDASNSEKIQKLKSAIESHKNYVIAAMNGSGCDRHLFGLKIIAEDNGFAVPEIFTDKGYAKSSNFAMKTSQVGSNHFEFLTFGPKYGQDMYTLSYNPTDLEIKFGITSWKSDSTTSSEKFRSILQESLDQMHDLLENYL